MRDRLHQLIVRLMAPRRLAALALVLTGFGLAADYVDAQRQADLTLALRKGPPAPVAVQAFDPALHPGRAGEVLVQGEVDMARGVVLTLRGSDPEARAWIAPLFPLSDVGRARMASSGTDGAAAVSAQAARRTADASGDGGALGYVLLRLAPGAAAPPDPQAVSKSTYGRGVMGAVVTLNGVLDTRSEFAEMADGALAAMGLAPIPAPVVVAPYPAGRLAALSRGPVSGSHEWVYSLALATVLLAAGESLRRSVTAHRGARRLRTADFAEEDASRGRYDSATASHPNFAPLPSQAELAAVDDTANAPAPAGGFLRALADRVRSRR